MSLNIQFHRIESVTVTPPKECPSTDKPFWYRSVEIVSVDHRGAKISHVIDLFSKTEDKLVLKLVEGEAK